MPISANALFHFTDDLDNLLNILENDFIPHFCHEDLTFLAPKRPRIPLLQFAIPMVSFCDIPLSQVADHMRVYGRYAIGMRLPWARTHHIAPVLYVERASTVAKALYSIVQGIGRRPYDRLRDFPKLRLFHEFACFTKAYDGPFRHHGRTLRNHRFYDEREWRFVPRRIPESLRYSLDAREFRARSRRFISGWILRGSALRFAPRDVKYVMVSSEDEITAIIRRIETGKSRFGTNQIRLLVSRVLSAEQVLEDF